MAIFLFNILYALSKSAITATGETRNSSKIRLIKKKNKECYHATPLRQYSLLKKDSFQQLPQNDQSFKDCFMLQFKKNFCGTNNQSLYTARNICTKSRAFSSLGIVLYILLFLFFRGFSEKIDADKLEFRKNFNSQQQDQNASNQQDSPYQAKYISQQWIHILLFEVAFAMGFSSIIPILSLNKQLSFKEYVFKIVFHYFIHITVIFFDWQLIEFLLLGIYLMLLLLISDFKRLSPTFSATCGQNNSKVIEVYHMTYLGIIRSYPTFFYINKYGKQPIQGVVVQASNKSKRLKKLSSQNLFDKIICKVTFNSQKQILSIWTRTPQVGIELILYDIPSLKCLRVTRLYSRSSGSVIGYGNSINKYAIYNKGGKRLHLFKDCMYLSSLRIPNRAKSYESFFVYEQINFDVVFGRVLRKNLSKTSYRVFKMLFDNKKWYEEERINIDDTIYKEFITIQNELVLISESWNIYIYNSQNFNQIRIITNCLLPTYSSNFFKYHRELDLLELSSPKEKCCYVLKNITNPKIQFKMQIEQQQSIFIDDINEKLICLEKVNIFFNRQVQFSSYNFNIKDGNIPRHSQLCPTNQNSESTLNDLNASNQNLSSQNHLFIDAEQFSKNSHIEMD